MKTQIPPAPPVSVLGKKDCDLLRTLASVMVVIAHCIHPWVKGFAASPDFFSLNYFACVIDQLTRFTVPLFLFLSGLGLTAQYMRKPFTLSSYYKKRLPKILWPFFIWSFIASFRHINYFQKLPWEQAPGESILAILKFLFLTGFDYQYYFLIVLFQFYLLFPLFFKLRHSKALIFFLLIVQMIYFAPAGNFLALMGVKLPSINSHIVIFHWLYCFMGIYVAANPSVFSGFLNRCSPISIVALWLALFGLVNFEFAWNITVEGMRLYATDHFNRWTIILYCFASLLLVLKLKDNLLPKLYKISFFNFVTLYMAPFTYLVYLGHTHFLRFVEWTYPKKNFFDMTSRTVTVLVLSYGFAWCLQILLRNYPSVRYTLSLPPVDIPLKFPRLWFWKKKPKAVA